MPSFDIVNEVDLQEVDNAVNNTKREVSTRYDFRQTRTEVEFNRKEKEHCAADERRHEDGSAEGHDDQPLH